jgi:hypothetical protein
MPDEPSKEEPLVPQQPKEADASSPTLAKTPQTEGLTAEEQMAAYEEDLKESDWGHQPC